MSMRISKYTPIRGVGIDMHGKLPGYLPPTPPLPPSPLVPRSPWLVLIAAPWASALTGKWSMDFVQTEGKGDILWGYDWGMGQVHIPVTPHVLTPSIPVLLLGSTTKYFLPSFAVREKIDGGLLAGSGEGPVAVSFPGGSIFTQQCHDNACALSFCFPSSVCFQDFSARWVGFCLGDFSAGFVGMLADAASAAILSRYGGKLIPGSWDDQLLGGLASSFMGQSVNVINGLPDVFKIVEGVLGGTLAGFIFAEGGL